MKTNVNYATARANCHMGYLIRRPDWSNDYWLFAKGKDLIWLQREPNKYSSHAEGTPVSQYTSSWLGHDMPANDWMYDWPTNEEQQKIDQILGAAMA